MKWATHLEFLHNKRINVFQIFKLNSASKVFFGGWDLVCSLICLPIFLGVLENPLFLPVLGPGGFSAK